MTPLRLNRDVRCPACGRYLGSVNVPTSLKEGDAVVTMRCRSCKKVVSFDQVSGQPRQGAERSIA